VATKEHKVIRFDSFIALIITNVNKVLIKWFLEKVGMEHYYLNNRIAKVLIYLISLFSIQNEKGLFYFTGNKKVSAAGVKTLNCERKRK